MNSAGRCPSCGGEPLWVRQPRYEGFRRVGEDMKCSLCGAVVEADEVSPAAPVRPSIFRAEDLPQTPKIFAGEEPPKFCRRCCHYVVNPFRQWCGLHRRDVAATDTCDQFEARSSDASAP